jgi:hypothetical protein
MSHEAATDSQAIFGRFPATVLFLCRFDRHGIERRLEGDEQDAGITLCTLRAVRSAGRPEGIGSGFKYRLLLPLVVTCNSPETRTMRSAEVWVCGAMVEPAGTLKKMSTLGFAGSP